MPKLANFWVVSVLLKLRSFQPPETHGERFLGLAADARSRIVEITPREAGALLGRLVVIDVREKEEFHRGHIRGAVNLPKGTVEWEVERRVPDPETGILVYCSGGNRSALVADNLQRMGYRRVKSLAGGFRAWQAAGLPVVRNNLLIED